MALYSRRGVYQIRVDGYELMSSRAHGSEERLAAATCSAISSTEAPAVLIGGLGLGYTLRAALDVLPAEATAQVVESVPAVVEWNASLIGHLAGHPLGDPRVTILTGDVYSVLVGAVERWDGVVLDVDNGPEVLSQPANHRLYDTAGLRTIWEALKPGGAMGLWSPGPSPGLAERLSACGFGVTTESVRARPSAGSPKHEVYVACKPT